MTTTYKEAEVQGTSSVTSYATLYDTSASGISALVSSIIVCNTAASTATYRIAVMGSAGTPSAANWRAYDTTVPANDSITLSLPIAMQNGRYIRVSSSANTVTFAAEIAEFSA